MLKTGLLLSDFGYGASPEEQIIAARRAGFDTFFTHIRSDEETERLCTAAADCGMIYESVHGPFMGIIDIWRKEGGEWVPRLKSCADHCARFGIGTLNLHCVNMSDYAPVLRDGMAFSERGVERFREIAAYCADHGVTLALENVEYPQWELAHLLRALRGTTNVGFTWDTGHEYAYTAPGFSLLPEFGDLLCGTHIHDNLGRSLPDRLTAADDLHLRPFTGTLDFDAVCRKLKSAGYRGTITLELKQSRDQMERIRHELPTLSDYLADAHARAVRIAGQCE